MENYCLYYLPPSKDPLNDVLTIYFGGNKMVTNRVDQNGISILLNKYDVVGYLIYNFSNFCKIKIVGTIFLPNDKLIDLINNILKNANLDTLPYKESSGLIIGEVIGTLSINDSKFERVFYQVYTGKETINCESTYPIELHQKLVIAVNGAYLLPARMIQEYKIISTYLSGGRICNYGDLQIDAPKLDMPVFVDDDLEVGSDFFRMEEKVNA